MSLNVKQTTEKFAANLQEVEKGLLPAVLADESAQIVSLWLQRNAQDGDGRIDGSVANIKNAVQSLHAAGLLIWNVAPAPKNKKPKQYSQDSSEAPGRSSAFRGASKDANLNSRETRIDELRDQRATEDNQRTLAAARKIYEEFEAPSRIPGRTNHSGNADGRKALRAEFERLTAQGLSPQELLRKMHAAANKQYDQGSGPRMGSI
jgi:hypothetical protein